MINYRKQMGALVTGQMLSLLLSFVLPLVLARILSKNDYGLYAQFNVILSFCITFFNFGFSSELYYSYPTAQEHEKKILVFQSFLMLLFAGVFATIILCFPTIKNYIISDSSWNDLYIYLLLNVLFSVPEVIITALYVLNYDHKTSTLFLPTMTLLRVSLILIFYYLNPSIESVFAAILLSTVLKLLFVLWYILKIIFKCKGYKLIDKNVLLSQLKYSFPLGIASSIRILIQQLDKLIILLFVTPSEYAVYSIAFYGVPGLTQVYLSISQVYIPRMAKSYKESNISELLSLYHSMVLKTLSYTIPIILIVCLFADVIIPFIFSEKYIDSVPYFRIYLLTFFIQSIGCGNILRAIGETKYSLLSYIYTAIIIIPLSFFLIKSYHLNGAIISATIAAIAPKVLLSLYDVKTLKIKITSLFPWKPLLKILVISIVYLLPLIYLKSYDMKMDFLLLLFIVFVYMAITFLTQMYYKVFIISYVDFIGYINKYFSKHSKIGY